MSNLFICVVQGHANEGDEAKDKQEKTKTELNAGAGKKTQLQDRPKGFIKF